MAEKKGPFGSDVFKNPARCNCYPNERKFVVTEMFPAQQSVTVPGKNLTRYGIHVCDLNLLPPISATMYWAFGRVKIPSTDALSLSDCMASIFLMVQNNAAASGSNAIFNCSGCSRDTIPAWQE